jgi:hypothetical protein
MGIAAWNPRLDFNGTTNDEDRSRAANIVKALDQEHPVTVLDLEGGSWRVMEFDTPTQEQAAQELIRLLDSLDPGWQDVLRIVTE